MNVEQTETNAKDRAGHAPATVRVWPRYLRRREASRYLMEVWGVPCAYASLMRMASVGGGPPFQYFGKRVVYTPANLDLWAAAKLSRLKRSTSDDLDTDDLDADEGSASSKPAASKPDQDIKRRLDRRTLAPAASKPATPTPAETVDASEGRQRERLLALSPRHR